MNFTKMSEDNKWKNISQYTERLKKKKSFFKK
jgi:hypothetical protein